MAENNFPFPNDDKEHFPWEDVNKSRINKRLQKRHSVKEAKALYMTKDFHCPGCNRHADELEWIYFSSPKWTWENLCGSEGWMVVCDDCNEQVNYFAVVIN